MTDLNTLKNWFKTGLKPSQEQFWAWMDSFYHKNEKIPQDKIQGLDKSLENKAEISALNAKTNVDATNLTEENIMHWREILFSYNNTKTKYITSVGAKSLYNLQSGTNVTAIGHEAGLGVKTASNSVFVGSCAGEFLASEKINMADVANICPVAVLVKEDSSTRVKDFYKDNFNLTETEAPGVFSSTLIGSHSGLGTKVNRSYFSIHIGTRLDTYNYNWRDYNNIIIGNNISTRHVNSQVFNSVIIGNFLDTWKPNTTDNILAIHNCKTKREKITEGLIYGEFEGRKLTINGGIKLNPQYAPPINNTYTKVAIANENGDLSFLTLGQLKGLLEGVTAEALPN